MIKFNSIEIEIKIEKGVKLFNHSKKHYKKSKYQKIYDIFDKMEINDSFLLPPMKDTQEYLRIMNGIRCGAVRRDFKIITRNSKDGFRVWKIKNIKKEN